MGRVGPFFAVFSGAAIGTRFFAGELSDRYGRKAVILPAAVLIGLNLFLISQVRSGPMFLVNAFLAGFGQGVIFPALSTYIIDVVGLAHKGFGLSLYLALFDTGMGLGSPFFGWVSDQAGYRGHVRRGRRPASTLDRGLRTQSAQSPDDGGAGR